MHKAGSTIPIRLRLCDASGANLSSEATPVRAAGLFHVSTSTSGEVEDAGHANPDLNFRFEGDSYAFNLQTKGLTTGTYLLRFTAGAEAYHYAVRFQIR